MGIVINVIVLLWLIGITGWLIKHHSSKYPTLHFERDGIWLMWVEKYSASGRRIVTYPRFGGGYK